MFSTPASTLGSFFRGLLSLAIIGLGIWLVYHWYELLPTTAVISEPIKTEVLDLQERSVWVKELTPWERVANWRPGPDRATITLVSGTFLLLLSFLGRWLRPYQILIGRKGDAVPHPVGESHSIPGRKGSTLHLTSYGSSNLPTLILTHGWGMNHKEWDYLIHDLMDKYRIIAWDLPGLGKSTPPTDLDYRLENLAENLRLIVEFSGAKPVTLIGHSIGGMTTLTFCRLFPNLLGKRVSKLVLVHTTYTNPLRTTRWGALYTALQEPVIRPLLYLQIGLSPLMWLMTWLSYWNGSVHSSTLRNGFSLSTSRSKLDFAADFTPYASPGILARGGLGMLQYDCTATLPSISIPVLLIAAENDPLTLASASERMASEIPNAKLRTLPATKHLGMIQFDREFAIAVNDFCTESSEPLNNVLKELNKKTSIA